MSPPYDPVLERLRASLKKAYGDKIERVVVFGSRARGDARPDSDYDVAVFLRRPDSFWTESGRLAAIETDILYETGAVVNALPFDSSHPKVGALAPELERDGLEL
jgi:predicted nucleotidyltransferase